MLICVWNPDFFEATNTLKESRWIILEGKLVLFNWKCTIGVIYGGYTVKEQQLIYNEINTALAATTEPILFMGDFNQVLDIFERRGQTLESVGTINLRSWMDDNAFN